MISEERTDAQPGIDQEQSPRERVVASFRKEVSESVREALTGNTAEYDISPLLEMLRANLEQERATASMPEFKSERLFWELVADELEACGEFAKLADAVTAHVGESGSDADAEIQRALKKLIERLSTSVLRSQDRLATALQVLRSRLEHSLPAILPRATATETMAQRKRLQDNTVEADARAAAAQTRAEYEKVSKILGIEAPKFLGECTWDVPALEEIRPGLVIEVVRAESGVKKVYEILGEPERDAEGSYWVRAKLVSVEGVSDRDKALLIAGVQLHGKASLADMGIAPYPGGLWSEKNRPYRWYQKEEKSS